MSMSQNSYPSRPSQPPYHHRSLEHAAFAVIDAAHPRCLHCFIDPATLVPLTGSTLNAPGDVRYRLCQSITLIDKSKLVTGALSFTQFTHYSFDNVFYIHLIITLRASVCPRSWTIAAAGYSVCFYFLLVLKFGPLFTRPTWLASPLI